MLTDVIKLETDSIILYGAGYVGLHFCDMLLNAKIKPICFYDRDCNKQGKIWNGIEIRNLELETQIDENALVVVCLLRNDELFFTIVKQLKIKGFHKIIHMQEIQVNKQYQYLFENQNLILFADKSKIVQNHNKIDNVRNLLEDEGKRIYDQIFNYIDSDFRSHIDSFPIEEQYWAYDLFTKNEEEVVFDCGAFDGTVMREFLKRNSTFKMYYAFEPDKANADRILNGEKISVIQKALSNKRESLSMRNYMNMNSVIINNGDFYVESMRLDEMSVKPTFIKIDVEGYEEKVLEGSRGMIGICRPIVACAIYHSVEQLWNIPQMIMEMTDDYVYLIRSYMNLYETIFYAIPKERKR